MTAESAQTGPAGQRERRAHGPWSDLALHTIGWRAFQDFCSQVCEVVLGRPVEIFREAQDGGQDAVFLIPGDPDGQPIGTVQCKHTSEAGKALKVADLRGQTRQTLARIDRFLADSGTDKSRLLTAQIWLKDIKNDFAGMNEVWDAWTAPNAAPTRVTAQCEMGASDVLVEIIVTAAARA